MAASKRQKGSPVTDAQLVLTMLPTADAAAEIARTLVEEKLAACCSLVPAVRSIYRWQEKIEDDNEVLVLIKTRTEQFERLKSRLLELHPYEVPEVLALPVEAGYAAYLEWMAKSLG
jgi:periplasmic divalent cation tolerance protein